MKYIRELFIRLISTMLLALLLLTTASCVREEPLDTGDTDVLAETGAPAVEFNITADYVLIRPDIMEPNEVDALTFISRGLKSVLGVSCKITTDWVKRGEDVVPAKYEILIGDTNRTHSKDAGAEISYNDYKYEIISENVIVIRGGCPVATLEAARSFMRDIFGYEESADFSTVTAKGSHATLKTGTSYKFEYDYAVETLKIGGYNIEDFTLVTTNGKDAAAKYIISQIADMCGFIIPVVGHTDYSTAGPAIFLGCADASGKHLDKIFDTYSYYITAAAAEAGPQISIDMTSSSARLEAAERFISLYFGQVKVAEIIEVNLHDGIVPGFAFGSDSNGLLLSENTESIITDGIVYSERYYLDENNLPVRAYVLTIKKGSGRFYTGTPEDGEALLNKGGTVVAEMNAAVANGKTVIAGVNADFFDMGGNYMPRGLCIKEGKLLNPAGGRPWFGVTADGNPLIGSSIDYDKYAGTIYNAVGGSNILLANSRVADVALGSEFNTTRHPRTAVGFKANGDIVMVVVDGRQSAISNGASLADLAKIFRELDCTDAINLDGGGSSTFVLKDALGKFTVMNSPSGGTLRKIQNSLLLLLP